MIGCRRMRHATQTTISFGNFLEILIISYCVLPERHHASTLLNASSVFWIALIQFGKVGVAASVPWLFILLLAKFGQPSLVHFATLVGDACCIRRCWPASRSSMLNSATAGLGGLLRVMPLHDGNSNVHNDLSTLWYAFRYS